jgi:penicillin-binding protein 1A
MDIEGSDFLKKNSKDEINLKNNKKTKNDKLTTTQVFFNMIFSIFKVAIPLVFILGVTFMIIIIVGTEPINVDDLRLDLTSSIYYLDDNGNKVEYEKVSSSQNRFWVPLNKVPIKMREAFVAIEDERFYLHSGFDIKRTTKAILDFMKIGNKAQGGSTITQQLIKNITDNDDRTPVRKIQEIYLAFQLERKLSKDQILELYVNTIYLAQGINGVQTAAKLYFSKDVSDLTLAECASIAGITQYPTRYDPFLHPENNKTKQEIVLSKMLELGKISKAEYDKSKAEKLNFKKGNMKSSISAQSYFVDQVITDVVNALVREKGISKAVAEKKIYSGGYKIISTIDPNVQKSIDNVFENVSNFPKSPTSVIPQGAIVVMDPKTGYIKGMSGGIGKKPGSFSLNRATQTTRQPGSTIKPLSVYTPAIENELISATSIYNDEKTSYGSWTPKNYYNGFYGNMTIKKAIQLSVNTIPVQILKDIGIDKSYNYLKDKFKISTLDPKDKNLSSLALGGMTNGVSVLEMTAAYATFANKGIYTKPTTYIEVIDSYGKKVLVNKKVTSIAMNTKTVSIMNDLLVSVVNGGTGSAAKISGISVGGKTGTTDEDKDRWFIGFTPDYVAAVWYGFDQPKGMGYIKFNPALQAWTKVIKPIQKVESKTIFEKPQIIENIKIDICNVSGKLPTQYCRSKGTVETESFKNGEAPTDYCSEDRHKGVNNVDPSTADIPQTPNETASPIATPSPNITPKPTESAKPTKTQAP